MVSYTRTYTETYGTDYEIEGKTFTEFQYIYLISICKRIDTKDFLF